MHALFAFSERRLASEYPTTTVRTKYLLDICIATRGLREAVGNLSHLNADSVLATSLLLLWQAEDLCVTQLKLLVWNV
jgi:hypothetical protein